MSEVRKVKPHNRAARKIARAKKATDPLLAGYYFQQIDAELQEYKDTKYNTLPNTGTAAAINKIQSELKGNEFKFTPILHNDKHWCCGVITPNEIYVFDSTLQTKDTLESGELQIGNCRREVHYLNDEPIQSDDGKICGPCVVEFSKKIAGLKTIEDVLKVCKDGTIFKDVAQEIYNKLQDKASAEVQFTKKYYEMIYKRQREGEQGEHKEEQHPVQQQEQTQQGLQQTKQSSQQEDKKDIANAAFGNVHKNLNKDRIPLFESLSQLTPAEDTGRIQAPEIEAVEGMDVSIGRHHGMQ